MFLLILGSFCLSILLVFTIAYLWIYLGHFNAIEVGVKTAKFAGKAIAYKEYDEDFDYIPARYREVLTDYPGHISCGVYEKYNQDDFEGKYKIGVVIETEADVLKGYDFEYLPQDQFCVCSDFNYNDPIQIRVGLKKCLDKMKEFILARELKIETFYEVYEPNCAHYVFTLPNQPN